LLGVAVTIIDTDADNRDPSVVETVIVAVPALTSVTIPEDADTLATPVLLDVHAKVLLDAFTGKTVADNATVLSLSITVMGDLGSRDRLVAGGNNAVANLPPTMEPRPLQKSYPVPALNPSACASKLHPTFISRKHWAAEAE
jgi:hypothetical protein